MRLSEDEARIIRATAAEVFGDPARVWLFGSRVDDTALGGDIDLLIETPSQAPLRQVLRAQAMLEMRLGTPVDIVTSAPDQAHSPIVEIARLTGKPLTPPASKINC